LQQFDVGFHHRSLQPAATATGCPGGSGQYLSSLVPLASRRSEPALKLILDPRWLLRWVLVGRLSLASAILVAVFKWSDGDASRTLVASVAFALSTIVAIISAIYTEVLRRRSGTAFLYLQSLVDVLLLTVVVHLTNGSSSPFSSLYILVFATASLLVPASGGLLVAALISDQKRLDAVRLQAQRLERIAELSASLAHEIRNPLASIRSAVEQISRLPSMTDDQKTLSALVIRESDRLSRLLGEFLDSARVRAMRVQRVDLTRMTRDVAALVAAHPDRSEKVRVTCTVPDDGIVHVAGDEDLLQRAIFNLALNAVQASSDNGDVCIELSRGAAEPILAALQFVGDAVSLRVTDHGFGIAPEIRDRMFDPFFTTKANGSGLGLAVVHRAIKAHGGHIFVDSSQNGTRFTVVLPRGREMQPRAPAKPPARSTRLEPTVLGAECA
jgi:signal transduction histidine kinase